MSEQTLEPTDGLARCILYAFNTLPKRPALSSWRVGPEYAGPHFAKLSRALNSLRYSLSPSDTALGGSQEVTTWVAIGPNSHLIVECETYIGLMAFGVDPHVEELRSAFDRPVA